MAQAVERGRIGATGDFNLSGERYVLALASQSHAFPLVAVSEIATRVSDSMNPAESDGQLNYVGLENIESNTGSLIGEVVASASDIKIFYEVCVAISMSEKERPPSGGLS